MSSGGVSSGAHPTVAMYDSRRIDPAQRDTTVLSQEIPFLHPDVTDNGGRANALLSNRLFSG